MFIRIYVKIKSDKYYLGMVLSGIELENGTFVKTIHKND